MTADVDVTVDLAGHTVDALVEALRGEAFTLRVDDAAFLAASRVLPLTHRETLAQLEEALGQSDLLPIFDRIWRGG